MKSRGNRANSAGPSRSKPANVGRLSAVGRVRPGRDSAQKSLAKLQHAREKLEFTSLMHKLDRTRETVATLCVVARDKSKQALGSSGALSSDWLAEREQRRQKSMARIRQRRRSSLGLQSMASFGDEREAKADDDSNGFTVPTLQVSPDTKAALQAAKITGAFQQPTPAVPCIAAFPEAAMESPGGPLSMAQSPGRRSARSSAAPSSRAATDAGLRQHKPSPGVPVVPRLARLGGAVQQAGLGTARGAQLPAFLTARSRVSGTLGAGLTARGAAAGTARGTSRIAAALASPRLAPPSTAGHSSNGTRTRGASGGAQSDNDTAASSSGDPGGDHGTAAESLLRPPTARDEESPLPPFIHRTSSSPPAGSLLAAETAVGGSSQGTDEVYDKPQPGGWQTHRPLPVVTRQSTGGSSQPAVPTSDRMFGGGDSPGHDAPAVTRPRASSNVSGVSFLGNTARLAGPSFQVEDDFLDEEEGDSGRESGSASSEPVSARGSAGKKALQGLPGQLTTSGLREELQGDMKRAGLLAATRVAQLLARREEAIVAMRRAAKEDAKNGGLFRKRGAGKGGAGTEDAGSALKQLAGRQSEAEAAREDERLRKEAVEKAMKSTEEHLKRDEDGRVVGLRQPSVHAFPSVLPSLPSASRSAAGSPSQLSRFGSKSSLRSSSKSPGKGHRASPSHGTAGRGLSTSGARTDRLSRHERKRPSTAIGRRTAAPASSASKTAEKNPHHDHRAASDSKQLTMAEHGGGIATSGAQRRRRPQSAVPSRRVPSRPAKMVWEQDSWRQLKQVEGVHFTPALAGAKAAENRRRFEQMQLAARESTGEDTVHHALATTKGRGTDGGGGMQRPGSANAQLVHSLAINLHNTSTSAARLKTSRQQLASTMDSRGDAARRHTKEAGRELRQGAMQRAVQLQQRLELAKQRPASGEGRGSSSGRVGYGLGSGSSSARRSDVDLAVGGGKEAMIRRQGRLASKRPRSAIVRWTPANSSQALKLLASTRKPKHGELTVKRSKPAHSSTGIGDVTQAGSNDEKPGVPESLRAVKFDPKRSRLSLQSMFQSKLPDLPPAPVQGSAQRRVEWVLEAVEKDHSLLKTLRQRAHETKSRLQRRKNRETRRREAKLEAVRSARREWLSSRLPVAPTGEAFAEGESEVHREEREGGDQAWEDDDGSQSLRGRSPQRAVRRSRPQSAAPRDRRYASAQSLQGGIRPVGGSLTALPRSDGFHTARGVSASTSTTSLRPVSAMRRTGDGYHVETAAVQHPSLGVVSVQSLQRACEGWVRGSGSSGALPPSGRSVIARDSPSRGITRGGIAASRTEVEDAEAKRARLMLSAVVRDARMGDARERQEQAEAERAHRKLEVNSRPAYYATVRMQRELTLSWMTLSCLLARFGKMARYVRQGRLLREETALGNWASMTLQRVWRGLKARRWVQDLRLVKPVISKAVWRWRIRRSVKIKSVSIDLVRLFLQDFVHGAGQGGVSWITQIRRFRGMVTSGQRLVKGFVHITRARMDALRVLVQKLARLEAKARVYRRLATRAKVELQALQSIAEATEQKGKGRGRKGGKASGRRGGAAAAVGGAVAAGSSGGGGRRGRRSSVVGVTGEGRRGVGRRGSIVTHEEPADLSRTETREVGGGGTGQANGALGGVSRLGEGAGKAGMARRGSVDLGSLQRKNRRLDRVQKGGRRSSIVGGAPGAPPRIAMGALARAQQRLARDVKQSGMDSARSARGGGSSARGPRRPGGRRRGRRGSIMAPDPAVLAQRMQQASGDDHTPAGLGPGSGGQGISDPALVESMDQSVEAALMVLRAAETELAAEAQAFTEEAKKEKRSGGKKGKGTAGAEGGGWKSGLRSSKRPSQDARTRRRQSIAEVEEHLESANQLLSANPVLMELGSSEFIVFGRLSERQVTLVLQKFLRERRAAVKKDRQEWMEEALGSVREMATVRLCPLADAARIVFPELQPDGPTLEGAAETDSDLASSSDEEDSVVRPVAGDSELAKWAKVMQSQGQQAADKKAMDEHRARSKAAGPARRGSPISMSAVVAHLHSRVMHAVETKDKGTMLEIREHLEPGLHAKVTIESGALLMKGSAYLQALTGKQRSALGLQPRAVKLFPSFRMGGGSGVSLMGGNRAPKQSNLMRMPSMVPGAKRGPSPPVAVRGGASSAASGTDRGSVESPGRRKSKVSFFGGGGDSSSQMSGLARDRRLGISPAGAAGSVSSIGSSDAGSASGSAAGGFGKDPRAAMRAFRSGSFRFGSKRRLLQALDKAEETEVREMLEKVCPVGLAGMYSLTANVQQLRNLAMQALQEADDAMAKARQRQRWGRAAAGGGAAGGDGVMAAVPFQ